MTNYDMLIDRIVDEMYWVWTEISDFDNEDDQKDLKETAHRILEHVEEFQSMRTKVNQWRASD
jgi:hypothetical protein